MPELTCIKDDVSIVLLGQLNPAIFQPAWFAANGLVRQTEVDQAQIDIIRPEVSSFSLGWLTLQVIQEKFDARAEAGSAPMLLDLVLGVFRLLSHTPLQKMGVNREMHFRMPDLESYHAVGHRLAPKEPWTGLMEKPGMLVLAMTGKRAGSPAKGFRVDVSASTLAAPDPAVRVATNEHFEAEGTDSTDRLMILLRERWADAQEAAQKAARRLIDGNG